MVEFEQQGVEERVSILEMNSVLFEDMNDRVQRCLYHPFLKQCEIVPTASQFHFDVASAVLRIAGVEEKEAKEVLTAVLLLQRGLDIHDDIDQQKDRKRQLYVLTGDYSSSQYYYVLAHLSDVSLLYELCDAVMRVNEAKMALLDLPSDELGDKQAQYYSIVEGQVLYALVNHYLDRPEHWLPQIESLVQAFILKETPSAQTFRNLPLRQVHEWLSDIIERLLTVQKNAILAPISAFFVDYLRNAQKNFERYTSALHIGQKVED
jgi:heptaprenyl diphosphate synthase